MARSTRIAVKLLLIVVMTIQPMQLSGLRAACSAGLSQVACQGCGCCAVESLADRCCCCDKTTVENSREQTPDHCDRNGSLKASSGDSSPCCSEVNEGAKLSHHGLGRIAERNAFSTDTRDGLAEGRKGNGCHCVHSPVAPSTPVPRSPGSEVRDLSSLTFSIDTLVEPSMQFANSSANRISHSSTVFHFAQIELCVWRL